MTAFAWPAWRVNEFQMFVQHNVRTFVGPYTPQVQSVDLLGARLACRIGLPAETDRRIIAQREAFFDRLAGPTNTITLGHLRKKRPLGTINGAPTLYAAIAQNSNSGIIQTTPGATIFAGDMLGIAGQLVRSMADGVADSSGRLAVEFLPRARVAMSAGAAVQLSYPTAAFILKGDSAPTTWRPDQANAMTIELIERP
jgi:hypothetical protein